MLKYNPFMSRPLPGHPVDAGGQLSENLLLYAVDGGGRGIRAWDHVALGSAYGFGDYPTALPWVDSPDGPVAQAPTNAYGYTLFANPLYSMGQYSGYTIAAWGRWTRAMTTTNRPISINPGYNGYSYIEVLATNQVKGHLMTSAFNYNDVTSSVLSSIVQGAPFVVVLTMFSGSMYLYYNGALVGSRTYTGTFYSDASTTIGFGCAPGNYSVKTTDGYVLGNAVWGRGLDSAEVALFADNPWMVLQPERRWLTVPGEASGKSMSLAASWAISTAEEYESSWRIMRDLSAVTGWSISSLVSLDSVWRVLDSRSLNSAWGIRAHASAITSWSIEAAHSIESAWAILGASWLLSVASSWRVLSRAETPTSWATLAHAGAVSAWRIKNSINPAVSWAVLKADTIPAGWAIKAAVEADASWAVMTAAEFMSRWRIGDFDYVPVPVARSIAVLAESRTVSVPRESRTVAINLESRTIVIM